MQDPAIDLATETVVSLTDATKALPLIDGKRPHVTTVWRWAMRGVRGVRLAHGRLGKRVVTSHEALNRFMNELAALDRREAPARPERESRPTARRRQVQAAKRALDDAGL